jgi:hypothetical protein
MFAAAPQPQPDSEEDRAISLLVGLAPDDLDCGNLDVEEALRFVAHRAWAHGYREAQNSTGGGIG